jgi:NlpC/P60 family
VNSDQGLTIIAAALESRHADANADCSSLVHDIYARAGFGYSYANSTQLYQGAKEFRKVLHPQPGDLVVWRGHVGIVISPVQHSFFSAMRSGRGVEFYDSPYWQTRGRPRFFRYLRGASPNELSASARKANLRVAGSRDPGAADEDYGSSPNVSSPRPATGTSAPGGDANEPVKGTVRAESVTPVEVIRANPSASSSTVYGPQEQSRHKSESQTALDAQSATDPRPTPASHKVQRLGDGVWERTTTKPSAGIPFDSVVTPTRSYEPPPDLRTSNIAAKTAHTNVKPASASGPKVNKSKSEPVLWGMSRYVPRPPWSLRSGRTSRPSVPRPPAGRVPRAIPGYAVSTWSVR